MCVCVHVRACVCVCVRSCISAVMHCKYWCDNLWCSFEYSLIWSSAVNYSLALSWTSIVMRSFIYPGLFDVFWWQIYLLITESMSRAHAHSSKCNISMSTTQHTRCLWCTNSEQTNRNKRAITAVKTCTRNTYMLGKGYILYNTIKSNQLCIISFTYQIDQGFSNCFGLRAKAV